MPRSDAKTKEGQNPPATPRGAPRWLPLLLVVVCFLLAGVLRLYHFRSLPDFNPVDDTAIFTTEDALQYRYARMVAEARPIPSVDPGLHHPEGFNVRDNLTTLVEGVEGRLYRLAGGGQPLHVFLITVVCFVTSLGVFAAYGAATALWRSRRSGVFAAALYAVAVPTYARIIGGYGTEHFALPLLFFGVWLLLAALETPEERRAGLIALASGGCFALALSAWHLSRFLFSLVLAGIPHGVGDSCWVLAGA
ncbi:MAG: hypothetical protein K0Q72_3620 [Armatimonadetes bacterium]|nr:hypothetical protein [Armatimonadota bacterium]